MDRFESSIEPQRFEISEDFEACVLHATHSPTNHFNETHHLFPYTWQRQIWGEVRDTDTVVVCPTAHVAIHAALRHWQDHEGQIPEWCQGAIRDMVEQSIAKHNAAMQTL